MVRFLGYGRAQAVVLDGPLAGCRGIVAVVEVKDYKS
jgi:hypothetical protein